MTIYQKLRRIAAKTVQHYTTDITVHDRAHCNDLMPGSLAIWTPRSHGSHFVWLKHPTDKQDFETVESLRDRLNWLDAVNDTFGNAQWYMLECIGQKRHGHVYKVETSYARNLFVERIKTLETAMQRQAA